MNTTEYIDFAEATAALHAAMAQGTNDVSMRTYQRPEDLKWVWAVTVSPSKEITS